MSWSLMGVKGLSLSDIMLDVGGTLFCREGCEI